MAKQKKSIIGWMIGTLVKLAVLLALISILQVAVIKVVNPPGTVNMAYEWVLGTWFDKPYVPHTYVWRDLNDISGHLKQAVLASEDQRFLSHNGFDFQEIRRVIDEVIANQKLRGASTISMQAARSLFLPSSRSVSRKAAELWYTILLELLWDKQRILEIYLNTVDWGTGIVGAQAAAMAYFSKDAGQLTPDQAALMAAVLPSPHKWSATHPGPYVQKRMRRIKVQMAAMPTL